MSRYITCEHEQGTPGWFADRLGMVTGSAASAVFARDKGNVEASTRADLRMNLVLERVMQKPTPPSFKETEAIAWGKEQEPHARMAYELLRGLDITESGFVYLKRIKAGCSVDGFIVDGGRQGVYEAKCPKSKNHYAYLLAGILPWEYRPQVLHNLWITGAEFCDFMSFDPRMPEKLQSFILRVERDEDAIRAHEAGVLQFLLETDAEEKKFRQLAGM